MSLYHGSNYCEIKHYIFEMNVSLTTALYNIKYKVIILGEMGVGKSSIIQQFIRGKIDAKYNSTVGIDLVAKNITYKKTIYKIQLWDTAGQERFKSLIPAYMKDANCAVIVYDITNPKSFHNSEQWYQMFCQHKLHQAVIVLVGNKSDQQKRQVTFSQGEAWAKAKDISFCQLSAKNGEGVGELFESIIENINVQKHQNQLTTAPETSRHLSGVNSRTETNMNKKKVLKIKENKKCSCCYI